MTEWISEASFASGDKNSGKSDRSCGKGDMTAVWRRGNKDVTICNTHGNYLWYCVTYEDVTISTDDDMYMKITITLKLWTTWQWQRGNENATQAAHSGYSKIVKARIVSNSGLLTVHQPLTSQFNYRNLPITSNYFQSHQRLRYPQPAISSRNL